MTAEQIKINCLSSIQDKIAGDVKIDAQGRPLMGRNYFRDLVSVSSKLTPVQIKATGAALPTILAVLRDALPIWWEAMEGYSSQEIIGEIAKWTNPECGLRIAGERGICNFAPTLTLLHTTGTYGCMQMSWRSSVPGNGDPDLRRALELDA